MTLIHPVSFESNTTENTPVENTAVENTAVENTVDRGPRRARRSTSWACPSRW